MVVLCEMQRKNGKKTSGGDVNALLRSLVVVLLAAAKCRIVTASSGEVNDANSTIGTYVFIHAKSSKSTGNECSN